MPFALYIAVGAVHLVALLTHAVPVSDATKPLLMPALLVGFLWALHQRTGRMPRGELALLGVTGILFSWLGDILLGTPGGMGFLLGLGAFFLAHVNNLVFFLRPLRRHRIPLVALVLVLWWVALLVTLAPHLGTLLVPVAIYGLVLGASAAASLGTIRTVAAGALLFLASDTVLALKMFLPGFSLWQADFLIMVLYIAGQGPIAFGAVRMARGRRK
ncbi:MAG: hypothetical protein JWO10_83 [Microbacteriaceae bacterium]|nr:hypothetical protein [Microbacteriaceae bacterium]